MKKMISGEDFDDWYRWHENEVTNWRHSFDCCQRYLEDFRKSLTRLENTPFNQMITSAFLSFLDELKKDGVDPYVSGLNGLLKVLCHRFAPQWEVLTPQAQQQVEDMIQGAFFDVKARAMDYMDSIPHIKGFKVFDSYWCCPEERMRSYQYGNSLKTVCSPPSCQDVLGSVFYKRLSDCFLTYLCTKKNRIAEVIGWAVPDGWGGWTKCWEDKKSSQCLTSKLVIVREIPWDEALAILDKEQKEPAPPPPTRKRKKNGRAANAHR